MAHFFCRCQRASDLWDSLLVRLLPVVPGLPSDWDLLRFDFTEFPVSVERLAVAHLGVLVSEL